jgi:hypothetical protein
MANPRQTAATHQARAAVPLRNRGADQCPDQGTTRGADDERGHGRVIAAGEERDDRALTMEPPISRTGLALE